MVIPEILRTMKPEALKEFVAAFNQKRMDTFMDALKPATPKATSATVAALVRVRDMWRSLHGYLPRFSEVLDQEVACASAELSAARPQEADQSVMNDDVLELLRALGVSDHARPYSCHRVVQDEILPAIRSLTKVREHLHRRQDEWGILMRALGLRGDTMVDAASRTAEMLRSRSDKQEAEPDRRDSLLRLKDRFLEEKEDPKHQPLGNARWWAAHNAAIDWCCMRIDEELAKQPAKEARLDWTPECERQRNDAIERAEQAEEILAAAHAELDKAGIQAGALDERVRRLVSRHQQECKAWAEDFDEKVKERDAARQELADIKDRYAGTGSHYCEHECPHHSATAAACVDEQKRHAETKKELAEANEELERLRALKINCERMAKERNDAVETAAEKVARAAHLEQWGNEEVGKRVQAENEVERLRKLCDPKEGERLLRELNKANARLTRLREALEHSDGM